jgi:hypothetical protein
MAAAFMDDAGFAEVRDEIQNTDESFSVSHVEIEEAEAVHDEEQEIEQAEAVEEAENRGEVNAVHGSACARYFEEGSGSRLGGYARIALPALGAAVGVIVGLFAAEPACWEQPVGAPVSMSAVSENGGEWMLFLGVGFLGVGCIFMGWFWAWTSLRRAREHYASPNLLAMLGLRSREPLVGILWRALTGEEPRTLNVPFAVQHPHGVSLLTGIANLLAGLVCLFAADWRAGLVGVGGALLGTLVVSILLLVRSGARVGRALRGISKR